METRTLAYYEFPDGERIPAMQQGRGFDANGQPCESLILVTLLPVTAANDFSAVANVETMERMTFVEMSLN